MVLLLEIVTSTPGARIVTFASVCFTLSLKNATERQLCLKWLLLSCSLHFHSTAIP